MSKHSLARGQKELVIKLGFMDEWGMPELEREQVSMGNWRIRVAEYTRGLFWMMGTGVRGTGSNGGKPGEQVDRWQVKERLDYTHRDGR